MHRVAEYNEKGYTFPVDIFTPAEAAANREYFNWIFAEASTRGINSYKVLTLPGHCRHPQFVWSTPGWP
jgi:hypothetical protein